YRKIHLFDVELKSFTFRESDIIQPGESDCIFETEHGSMGLTICFDLRFPELYRQEALKGSRVIFVPSAFTMFTGKDHWQPLIQARAIENQVFIVAANQIGASASGLTFYGRSLIVDPWGITLACAEDKETAIIADLDFDRQAEIRAELPTLPRVRMKIASS
ncbi:MAG: nitrilase-related carbon-nitrogen hydrolase, partial [Candidatus Bathyarchaeia archaeon]